MLTHPATAAALPAAHPRAPAVPQAGGHEGVVTLGIDLRCIATDEAAAGLLACPPAALLGNRLAATVAPPLGPTLEAACAGVLATRQAATVALHEPASGRWLEAAITLAADGVRIGLRDARARERAGAFAEGQRRTQELIALGAKLPMILDTLIRAIEAYAPRMICTILLLDTDGLHLHHAAAPSLAPAFRDAIEGVAIGPLAGSCGTACYRGEPVFVADIATDPLWAAYRALALPHGLRACWSTPIRGADTQVLGSFAIYHRMPGLPAAEDLAVIGVATHLAAIAIDRDRSERALRRSESRLGSILHSAPCAVMTFGPDQRIVLFNQAAATLFATSAASAIGQPVTRYIPDMGEPVSQILRGERTGGERFALEISVSRLQANGETMFTAMLKDIGEQQRHDGEIDRLRRLYAVLSDVNQAIVRHRSVPALLNEVCRAIVERGGFQIAWVGRYDPAAFALRPVAEAGDRLGYLTGLVIPTNSGPQSQGPTGVAFLTGTPYICNDFFRDAATRPWWRRATSHGIAASAAFQIRSLGRPWGTLTIYADETGLFQAKEVALLDEIAQSVSFGLDMFAREQDRSRAEEHAVRLAAIVDSTEDAIVSKSLDGIITSWNPAAERMFGYPAEAAIGQHIGLILPPDRAGEAAAILARIREGERVRNFETIRRRQDGSTFPCSVTISPIRDRDGTVTGASKIARDITERRQVERLLRDLNEHLEQTVDDRTVELRAAMAHAEAADRAKSAFLANMSHELRTPLNSIIGFTGIVIQGMAGPLNAEQAKQLGMVRSSARHLLALINDVLDISKIEAGQLDIHAEPFELHAEIVQAIASVQPAARAKGIRLHLAPEPHGAEALPMVSDRQRVRQILLNLLSNAIKFTEAGSVSVSVVAMPAYRSPGALGDCAAVRLSVADTGIGIRPENMTQLFKPFRQLDVTSNRQHEGTGLGLAICRRLAEMLGGEIEARSVWGEGSVFTVRLPVQAGAAP